MTELQTSNYNSLNVPENFFYESKGYINGIYGRKRNMNQKVKISSFINDFEEPNPVYLNREKISKPLDIQANDYTPI